MKRGGTGWERAAGEEAEGVFRVRGRLGQELTAQAGSKGRVGAPSPHQKSGF